MKRKLAVMGAGSAGLLSLAHFCTWLDSDWEIYSVHNPAKAILGIGESTNGEFVSLLERGTHFRFSSPEDMAALDATLKFGSKFQHWRENSWINPLIDGTIAIHFNNFRLKEFVFERLQKHWPSQFSIIEGDVTDISNQPDRVILTVDGQSHEFDYVMDCTGFPSSYEHYTLSDCTLINHGLIHSVTDFEYEPFTDHTAHPNGWMFGVPLLSRKTFGYMFNDRITSKEEAIEGMKQTLGVDKLDEKEYVFNCYYAQNLLEGRVCKNGNKALFFEPLVANSIHIYIYAARLFYDCITSGADTQKTNASFIKAVQEMEDVISYYYQGGSTFQSPFWEQASNHAKARLQKRREFKTMMNTYKSLKQRGILHTAPPYAFFPLNWEIIDEQMGYGYIQ
jgi:tryptophan 7-halogenase